MKRLRRVPEIESLRKYRENNPKTTWDEMKNDGLNCGPEIFKSTRSELFMNQGNLCAYCEVSVDIAGVPSGSRVEHFHPKSDVSEKHWHLVWSNLMGTCSGNTVNYLREPAFRSPHKKHLSCDAHKDRMIQTGKLKASCEGLVANPYDIPAFPTLFTVKFSTGELLPNSLQCASTPAICEDQPGTNEDLVEHTIRVLNLNCGRLCDARKAVVRQLNIQLSKARLSGETKIQAERRLANRHLTKRWPQFFLLIAPF